MLEKLNDSLHEIGGPDNRAPKIIARKQALIIALIGSTLPCISDEEPDVAIENRYGKLLEYIGNSICTYHGLNAPLVKQRIINLWRSRMDIGLDPKSHMCEQVKDAFNPFLLRG